MIAKLPPTLKTSHLPALAFVTLAALALPVASGPALGSTRSLFESQEVLRLELSAPLRELVSRSDTDFEAQGSISIRGGPAIPATVKIFGKSRLRLCSMPPLVLTPDPAAARGTLFEGQETLRIVTHCGHETGSDRWALLEYLAYRVYGLVAEVALSVRLAEIEYHDSDRKRARDVAYAFFVEDLNLLALDRGVEWLTLRKQSFQELDGARTTVLALFQHMIGNTDWSILKGPEGERCCHNIALLGREGSTERHLLPFDFDHSGLVNAPYAAPDKTLGMRSVRERRYRGFCLHNEHLPAAIDLFNERRPLIEQLFEDPALPHPSARKDALRYLDTFYQTINDPKRLRKTILRRCRRSAAGR